MPRVEYTASESKGFEAWPKGDYALRIIKCEHKTSKKENPQLAISLECIEGDYEGKKSTHFETMADGGGFGLDEILEATIPGRFEKTEHGEKDKNGNRKFLYAFDTDDLIDTTVIVSNTPETYNNEERNRFRKWRPYVPASEATNLGHGQAQGSQEQAAAGNAQAPEDTLPQQQRTERRRVAST